MSYSLSSNAIGTAVSPIAQRPVSTISAPSVKRISPLRNLIELLRYRDLIYTLTLHRIHVRYKQSVLGVSWAIIQPLSMMLMFTAVFSLIARIPSEGAPYAIFAYTALLPWNFFSTSVTNATGGLVNHSQLVTKVYFPREILPLSYILAALFDLVIGAAVLASLMIYYNVGVTLNAVSAIPVLFVLGMFALSIALILSATQVHFRDIGMAVPLVLQLWMFATPVLYPTSSVPARFHFVFYLNPMAGIIDNFRRVVLHGAPLELRSFAASAVFAIVLLAAAYIYFKRVERTMADFI